MFKSRKFRFFPQQIACWHIVSSPSTNLVITHCITFLQMGLFCLVGPDEELTMYQSLQENHPNLEDGQDLLPVWWGRALGTSKKTPKHPTGMCFYLNFWLYCLSFSLSLLCPQHEDGMIKKSKSNLLWFGRGRRRGMNIHKRKCGQSDITGFIKNLWASVTVKPNPLYFWMDWIPSTELCCQWVLWITS